MSRRRFTRKFLPLMALVLVCLLVLSFQGSMLATQVTISVTDGTVSDWAGVSKMYDAYGDVSGVGPNDITKFYITSDSTNIYARWDVMLTGSKTKATSASYAIAIDSHPATGTTRPTIEAMAYVGFDSKGAVSEVSLENATKKISLPLNYCEQIYSGVSKTSISIEAKFPFADFNNNGLTINPLTSNSLFPLWAESLSSPSYNSVVKDYVPDMGYLNYDSSTGTYTPRGTGPIASITTLTTTPKVVPSAVVRYSLSITNIGDTTGAANLLFNTMTWTLPAGFTYTSGSTTGITTSNPTISGQTLTWTVSGSLAPNATATLYFDGTASATTGKYYSSATTIAQTPAVTYETGETENAAVDVQTYYTPPAAPTLSASGTTQTTTNLSWTTVSGATYNVYKDGTLIASGLTGTTLQATGLTPGTSYNFTVKAVSSYGVEGGASNTAAVTTISPYTVTVNSFTTNDNTPVLTGTTNAPNSSTMSVVINGRTYNCTVTSGAWSVEATTALADAAYPVTATVSGAASQTGNGTVTIDTTPYSITLTSLVTNNNKPTITGTTNAPNGATITLTINGQSYTGTASGGAWSIAVNNALTDNIYPASASVTDPAGNVGTANGTVTVDTVAPTVTVNNLSTNDNTPSLSGTTNAANGRTVTVVVGGHTYTCTANNGYWTVNVTDVLPDNTYTVNASVSDDAGNVGNGSGTLLIDTIAPTITINNLVTNDTTPTLTGTTNATNGSTVTLTVDGVQYTGTANNGSWSITVTNVLNDNNYATSATVSDSVGNVGTANGTLTVDTQPYTVSVDNKTTNDNTPTLTGSTNAPDGTVLTIVVDSHTYYATASGGAWATTVTNPLSDATYMVYASVTDAAGNVGQGQGTLVIDTQAPAIVVNDLTTNDTTPTITGTTDAANGATITLVVNGQSFIGTANNGTWSINVTDALTDDTYIVTASVQDVAGNTGSDQGTLVIDTVGPAINVHDLSTNDNTPTITGTTDAADGSTITLVVNGHTYTGTCSGGIWSINVTDVLSDGLYDSQATVEDALGNSSSHTGKVNVDTYVQSDNNYLIFLELSDGTLSPAFDKNTQSYTGNVPGSVSEITVIPTSDEIMSTITVNGQSCLSAHASQIIPLNIGQNVITVVVTAEDKTTRTYTVTINRAQSVIGVSLDKHTLDMYFNETSTLVATVTPSDATDKFVTWSSSDESVATVDQNGKVTGITPGTATITVTTRDGGKTDSCEVTVKDTEITIYKKDGKTYVNIHGWDPNYQYQIWTFQHITSDLFLDTQSDVKADQWLLAMAYTHGRDYSVLEADGSISFEIAPFISPDGNYRIALRIMDDNGNYIKEMRNAFTPDDVLDVKITKVLVNGKYTDNRTFLRIQQGSIAYFTVVTNNVPNTVITAKLVEENMMLQTTGTPNVFAWDISGKTPDDFTIEIIANNGSSTFTRIVEVTLYELSSTTQYATISGLSASAIPNGTSADVTLTQSLQYGDKFEYFVSELGRSYKYRSSKITSANGDTKNISNMGYGIYNVTSFVYRNNQTAYDDGMRTFFEIPRPRGGGGDSDQAYLFLTGTHDGQNVDLTKPVQKNDLLNLTANGHISAYSGTVYYSFWRVDADGSYLIKDWSSDNTLAWNPNRIGDYIIEVRIKGDGSGSYEHLKDFSIAVANTGEHQAEDVTININLAEIQNNVSVRVPFLIQANAVAGNGEQLLYRFFVDDHSLGMMQIQPYSANRTAYYKPRKSGSYTIVVQVKSQASYGYFDAQQSFEITVP